MFLHMSVSLPSSGYSTPALVLPPARQTGPRKVCSWSCSYLKPCLDSISIIIHAQRGKGLDQAFPSIRTRSVFFREVWAVILIGQLAFSLLTLCLSIAIVDL